MAHQLLVADRPLSPPLDEILADCVEVHGLELLAGTAGKGGFPVRQRGLAGEDGATKRLRESKGRLAQVPLEILDDGRGEIEALRATEDVVLAEVVLHHEKAVGLGVALLHQRPAITQAELRRLEEKVGVLSARHLVHVDVGAAGLLTGLERRIKTARQLPVVVKLREIRQRDARVQLGSSKGLHDRAQARLGRGAAHRVNGTVHGIGAGLQAREHRRDARPGGVVGVDVDRQVRMSFANGTDQQRRRLRLEQARHVLDRQDVDPGRDQLVNKTKVVLERVRLAGRVGHVARVADGALDNAARGSHGVDAEAQVVHVVEGVEDAEHVHSGVLRDLAELVDHVVRVVGVSDPIRAAEEHLERHERHRLAQLLQSVPRALVQEAHADVEGRAAPALKAVRLVERICGRGGDGQQIFGAHAGCQQGLVSIAPGGVRDQRRLRVPNGLGKGLGALLVEDLLQADRGVARRRDRGDDGVHQAGRRSGGTERVRRPVDDHVCDEAKELLSPVLAPQRLHEARILRDEARGHILVAELGVLEHVEHEADVGGHAANPELAKGAGQLSGGVLAGRSVRGDLHKQRVVVGGDVRAEEARPVVHADAHAARRAEDFNGTGVRSEVRRRVLRRDATLHGDALRADLLLAQAEVFERGASSDADLRLHNVDARDLLGHRVLHLHAGVDLDEVEAALLVHEELDGACVAVLCVRRELLRVVEERLARVLRQALGRRDFNDLLVAALDRAVSVVEVHDVSGAIAEDLDLDVPRLRDEALDENGAIAEGGKGLAGRQLEVLLELLLGLHHAHAFAPSAHGGLDDDGISDGVVAALDELAGLLQGRDRAIGAGHHGDADFDGQGSRHRLIPKLVQVLHGGTNEGYPGCLQGRGEVFPLGEEAVSGMHGVDAVLLGGLHDGLDVEVGSDGALALANLIGEVSLVPMLREAVLFAVDAHGLEACQAHLDS
eukprot:scaffold300_cov258-Pinguiococcus_pyrenoidosus.AAC.31